MSSPERELLGSCLDEIQYHEVPCPELVIKIKELLAQPQLSTDSLQLTEQASFKPDWVNYRQGVEDSKREPLSFDDLNNMWCGNPIDFARRIESIHGIGVDDE